MEEEAKADLSPPQRFGFLVGKIKVPADFDRMGADEITALFEGTG